VDRATYSITCDRLGYGPLAALPTESGSVKAGEQPRRGKGVRLVAPARGRPMDVRPDGEDSTLKLDEGRSLGRQERPHHLLNALREEADEAMFPRDARGRSSLDANDEVTGSPELVLIAARQRNKGAWSDRVRFSEYVRKRR